MVEGKGDEETKGEKMNDEHYVDLETLSDGAGIALVNREFQKVWDNIADQNTVA